MIDVRIRSGVRVKSKAMAAWMEMFNVAERRLFGFGSITFHNRNVNCAIVYHADFAEAALWLASDATFVTGEILQINGRRALIRLG